MIMVDELTPYPRARHRCFRAGACHLTTDGPLDELHAFAARLGMKRAWYQEHPLAPHYDLTEARRARALELGAVFVPARKQARDRLARRRAEASRDLRAQIAAVEQRMSELDFDGGLMEALIEHRNKLRAKLGLRGA